MEDILRYRAFIRAVELGSISAAAQDLGFSQSSISRMISSLESEWQVILLERSRAGLCLTSEGEVLLERARDVVCAQASFASAVGAIKNIESGTVRIATFSSIATHVLPKIIGAFLKEYPGISYELLLGDYDEIETWTEQGRVDFGISRLPSSPKLKTEALLRDELMVVLPKGHRLAQRAAIPAQALLDERFFLLEKDDNTVVDDVFESCASKPIPAFKTWDDYSIMAMVEAGLGVSILPSLILRRIPYRLEIRPLEKPVYRNVGLVTKKVGVLSQAAQKLYEQILRSERQSMLKTDS